MTIDPLTFLFEVFNFLVLLWLLKRFLYRPVLNVIAQRQAEQKRVQDEAGAQMREAEMLRQHYEQRLSEWADQRGAEQERLQRELAVERERQLQNIQKTAEDEQARIDARRETERAAHLQTLRKLARQEALTFATRLLQRLSDADLNIRLIDIFLEDLQQMPPEQLERLRNASTRPDSLLRITSSHVLSRPVTTQLHNTLEQLLQHPCNPQFVVDTSLVCGLRVEIGTCILEANFAGELSWFADLLERGYG